MCVHSIRHRVGTRTDDLIRHLCQSFRKPRGVSCCWYPTTCSSVAMRNVEGRNDGFLRVTCVCGQKV